MARVIAFVDRFHWLWLVLAAPLLIFPAPARAPALLVVPLVWLAGWLARPLAPLARTPANAPLLALMAMVLVSVLVTPDPAFSLTKVSNVVLGIGVFFAVAREGRRPTGFRWSLALFVLIGAGVAAVSLLGTVWGTKIGFLAPITSILVPRLMGLPGAEEGFNPNQVAGALLWVAPVLVWLLLQPAPVFFPRRDTKGHEGSFFVSLRVLRGFPILEKLLLGLGAALVLGVLLLTQSRGAYIGLVLALAGAAWLCLPRRWRWVATGVVAHGCGGGRRHCLGVRFGRRPAGSAVQCARDGGSVERADHVRSSRRDLVARAVRRPGLPIHRHGHEHVPPGCPCPLPPLPHQPGDRHRPRS